MPISTGIMVSDSRNRRWVRDFERYAGDRRGLYPLLHDPDHATPFDQVNDLKPES
jgi:hypothetical protein